jgi:hypothetical protein
MSTDVTKRIEFLSPHDIGRFEAFAFMFNDGKDPPSSEYET